MDVGLLMSEMNNMPFPRYCCWSIIQVFAVVAFYRNGVSGGKYLPWFADWGSSIKCVTLQWDWSKKV